MELERYLKQLDNYDILSKEEARLYERYKERPDNFSTASISDAASRRQTKIDRFKEEKALKEKLEVSMADFAMACDVDNQMLTSYNLSASPAQPFSSCHR